jgi:hypothetical protein
MIYRKIEREKAKRIAQYYKETIQTAELERKAAMLRHDQELRPLTRDERIRLDLLLAELDSRGVL